MKKRKILVLSDHPLSPSGVGTQTKYMIDALLKTGRYQFICLGGAVKHQDYTPQRVDPWGDDWRIFPVDGYGTQEMGRSILSKEKPDLLSKEDYDEIHGTIVKRVLSTNDEKKWNTIPRTYKETC